MRYVLKDIEYTLLKAEQISTNVASVAEHAQGYVIMLVSKNLELAVAAKETILLEGYASTLAFVNTPHKFELCMDKDEVYGQWHAAQSVARTAFHNRNTFGKEVSARVALDRTIQDLSKQSLKSPIAAPKRQ